MSLLCVLAISDSILEAKATSAGCGTFLRQARSVCVVLLDLLRDVDHLGGGEELASSGLLGCLEGYRGGRLGVQAVARGLVGCGVKNRSSGG